MSNIVCPICLHIITAHATLLSWKGGVISMFTISDYEKLQQIMEESAQHKVLIEKLLASHEEQLRTLRHEINNSLTLISSSLQFIESTHPEVRSFRYWNTLSSDIADITALLKELSVSNPKFDEHTETLHTESLHTTDYLRALSLSFAASTEHTGIEFTAHIPENLPDITVDPLKLKEVLLNLFQNAVHAVTAKNTGSDTQNKHTKEDSAIVPSHAAIRLQATVTGEWLQIELKDNGCGIPNERLGRIFEPFVTYRPGGTGLGLSLSKQIIEAHQGTLKVSSKVGIGTTFTVRLPIC